MLTAMSFKLGTNLKTGEPQWKREESEDGYTIVYVVDEESDLKPLDQGEVFVVEDRHLIVAKPGFRLMSVILLSDISDSVEEIMVARGWTPPALKLANDTVSTPRRVEVA